MVVLSVSDENAKQCEADDGEKDHGSDHRREHDNPPRPSDDVAELENDECHLE